MRIRSFTVLIALLVSFVVPNAHALEKIVITLQPLSLIVKEILDPNDTYTILVAGGIDPHMFELTPQIARQVSSSRVVISHGLHLDSWLPKSVLENNLFTFGTNQPDDTHLWLDPQSIQDRVEALALFLCKNLSKPCEPYLARAHSLSAQLSVFTLECRKRSELLNRKKFVAMHNAWSRFAKACGLEQVGVLKESDSYFIGTRDYAKISENIRRHQVKILISDVTSNPALVKSLEIEHGLTSITLNEMGVGSDSLLSYYQNVYSSLESSLETTN